MTDNKPTLKTMTSLQMIDEGDAFLKARSEMTMRNWWKKHDGDATVYGAFVSPELNYDGSRYIYDGHRCKYEDGWRQYDTSQDAWYFGVWYHTGRRVTVTYAEGDETIVVCHTEEAWKAELREMAEFYGEPPPAFRTIDTETGQVTHYIDENARPEAN
jgi:hypothetical protein